MHKKDKSKNLNIGSLNECNSNNINDNNKLVKSNNKKNKLTEKWREFEYIVKEIVTETLEKSDVIIIDNILTAAQKDRGVDISITVSNKLNMA